MSNALEMSRKKLLTSAVGLLSKTACISCIIDSNWAIHEPPGGKPDWEGVKSLLLRKCLNRVVDYPFKYFTKKKKWTNRAVIF